MAQRSNSSSGSACRAKTSETAISFGTSFRFVAERAGFDVALQRVWRKGGAGFTEKATLLSLGVSVRP